MREYIIYLGFPSNGGARLATLSFNVLEGILQAKDLLLHFFRMGESSNAGPSAIDFENKTILLIASSWMQHLQVFFPRAAPLSLYNNQDVLCGHINDRSTVLQEKINPKRLYVSALIISICLCRGRSAFMPAPAIFGDGKLNLLPTSIYFIVFQQLYICPPKMLTSL